MMNRQNSHQHSSLPPSPKLNKHRNSIPKLSPTSPALTIVSSADDDEEMSPVNNGRKSARSAFSQPHSPGLRVSFDEGDNRGHDAETITIPTTDSHRSENDDTSVVTEEGSCDPVVYISDNYVREDQVRQMSPNLKMMNGGARYVSALFLNSSIRFYQYHGQ